VGYTACLSLSLSPYLYIYIYVGCKPLTNWERPKEVQWRLQLKKELGVRSWVVTWSPLFFSDQGEKDIYAVCAAFWICFLNCAKDGLAELWLTPLLESRSHNLFKPENAWKCYGGCQKSRFFFGSAWGNWGLMSEGHQLPTTTILMFMLAQMSNHKCPLEWHLLA